MRFDVVLHLVPGYVYSAVEMGRFHYKFNGPLPTAQDGNFGGLRRNVCNRIKRIPSIIRRIKL